MPREKIPYPSKDAWKEYQEQFRKRHRFNFNRKARYLVDESLGIHTTALIRHWGYTVTDVFEAGIAGQPDENVFHYARHHRRIILTHDDDFLDNALFPLKGSHGIAVLPFASGGNSGLEKALGHFLAATSDAGLMFQTKIKVGEQFHWTVFTLTDEGAVTSQSTILPTRIMCSSLHKRLATQAARTPAFRCADY
jgi:hypothetical protein